MIGEQEWVATSSGPSPHAVPEPAWAELLLSPTGLLVVGAVACALIACQFLRTRIKPKPLMSRVEREVLGHLEAAVPWCRVHAQVCLGALLQPSRWLPRKTRARQRYGYSWLIVDFVLEDRRTGYVVALVELDDRHHNHARDRERDRLTARAGYLTIRLPASEYPSRSTVLARVSAALNERNRQTSAAQARRALHDLGAIATAGLPAKPSKWGSRKGRAR